MEIYIVLTKTGTILSHLVRIIKGHKYTHVSISLDKELTRMYSFGRRSPYNPFSGTFVHEGINWGTFKRFKNTKCVILKLKISQEEYQKAEKIIDYFENNKGNLSFNILGLVRVIFNKRTIRKNKYYCAEFVKYVFDEAKIKNNLPFVVTPNDFFYLQNIYKVYEGYLKDYA